jgi:hypothetical protein
MVKVLSNLEQLKNDLNGLLNSRNLQAMCDNRIKVRISIESLEMSIKEEVREGK